MFRIRNRMDSHFIRVQESGYTSVKIGQKTLSFFSANVLEPGSPSQRFKVNLRTHIKKKIQNRFAFIRDDGSGSVFRIQI